MGLMGALSLIIARRTLNANKFRQNSTITCGDVTRHGYSESMSDTELLVEIMDMEFFELERKVSSFLPDTRKPGATWNEAQESMYATLNFDGYHSSLEELARLTSVKLDIEWAGVRSRWLNKIKNT